MGSGQFRIHIHYIYLAYEKVTNFAVVGSVKVLNVLNEK